MEHTPPKTSRNATKKHYIEGWHRKFQGLCLGHHSKFRKFVDTLKQEQSCNRAEVAKVEGGHSPPAQRSGYVDYNRRILTIVDNLEKAFDKTCRQILLVLYLRPLCDFVII